MTTTVKDGTADSLQDKRVAFVGKLGSMTRREARDLIRQHGGTPVDKAGPQVDLVVIGADELPLGDPDQLLDGAVRTAAAEGSLEIITETQFWQRLGQVEGQQHVRRLYTPAMLADLIGVSVSVIRRWHRRGLIVPKREVRRLPYFDFQEVATAQRLAQLLAAGASPRAIEKKLEQLARYLPEIERPLAQLSIIVEGKQILLRQGEGLIEPGGQLRFDFQSLESADVDSAGAPAAPQETILSIAEQRAESPDQMPVAPEQMSAHAAQLEDDGQLIAAAEMYRAALAAGGPTAEGNFQLAELLYRMGDVPAARERYYTAIELDEDFVEARANLGCVLAETGQMELAVAAFEGALRYHDDFPDVHYHLARTLDELQRPDQAERHWQIFLDLAPTSPWADEARSRLE